MSEMDHSADHPVDDAVEAADAEPGELSIETPEADAVEQHTAVRERTERLRTDLPGDVDEADAADQRRVVELDEDDYR
jgi:hypothetical protein